MTIPSPTNLSPLFAGDARTIHITVKTKAGDAIDLTGYTVEFAMKANKSQPTYDVLIEADTPVDPTLGIVDIQVLSEHTADLIPRQYFYDIQLKTASLQNKTIAFGSIMIMEDINKG